jgi:predicted alpha-1,2-mannosidase
MINPSIYQDIDEKNHNGHTRYTIFSLWDTYRALHPLINLTDTAMSRNIAYTLYAHYERSPHHMLPVWSHHGGENWCMIGYHGVSVMVDAAVNTILPEPNIEWELETMNAIFSTSNKDYYDFTGLYKELGYVPFDKSRNGTSVTLENAYEDWCVYWAMSRGLDYELPDEPGYPDSVMESYRQRALNYRNVYKDGFVRARYSDGSWKTPYSLLSTSGEGLIEGNAWNYSFYVPHDVNGMMQMMGGEKAFVRKLDTLFTMHVPDEFFAETEDVTREGMLGGYVHGNEPSHHIPYLYMWTTQPWKTQYWVREVMNRMYRNHIDGLCGNDDCGQMSAWYIFSAMGFYPVCPASGQYVIGAPYLPYMKVRMGSGKYLEIKAPKVSDKNRYIQRVLWNGKPYDKCYVTYRQLMEGGTLEFQMGPKPNKRLFQAKDTKPYSLTK